MTLDSITYELVKQRLRKAMSKSTSMKDNKCMGNGKDTAVYQLCKIDNLVDLNKQIEIEKQHDGCLLMQWEEHTMMLSFWIPDCNARRDIITIYMVDNEKTWDLEDPVIEVQKTNWDSISVGIYYYGYDIVLVDFIWDTDKKKWTVTNCDCGMIEVSRHTEVTYITKNGQWKLSENIDLANMLGIKVWHNMNKIDNMFVSIVNKGISLSIQKKAPDELKVFETEGEKQ